MLKKSFSMVGCLLLIAFLNVNAILKNEDPIADTQTEGILYDQKVEQEKDGVKAAATPRMVYYGGQGFLTKGSLAKNEKETSSGKQAKKKDAFNWSDWWEEKPADQPKSDVAPEAEIVNSASQEQVIPSDADVKAKPPTPQVVPPEDAVTDPFGVSPAVSDKAPSDVFSSSTESPVEPNKSKASADDWW